MKKLLLKLAAVALCALSPHQTPVAAQIIKSVSFKGYGNNNPEFRYSRQLQGAVKRTNTTSQYGVTQATSWAYTLDETKTPTAYPSTFNSNWTTSSPGSVTQTTSMPWAQGQFNWGEFQMEFDYYNCAKSSTTASNWTTSITTAQKQQRWCYTSYLYPGQDDTGEGYFLNLYPGAEIKFSYPGKRIKRIVLHTGLPVEAAGGFTFNGFKLTSNLRLVDAFRSTQTTAASTKATLKYVKAADGTADVVITANDMWGTDSPFFLRVNEITGIRQIPTVSTTVYYPIPLATAASAVQTKQSALQNNPVFRITDIDIEYYESIPFTTTLTQGQTDGIQYYNQTTSAWENQTGAPIQNAAAHDIEKARIGDFIIEVDASKRVNNALTVNSAQTFGVGLHVGTRFRIYPDPEKYKMKDGTGAKSYKIKAYLSGNAGTFSGVDVSAAWISARNAATVKFSTTQPDFTGTITMPATGGTPQTQTAKPDYVFEAMTEKGMSSDTDNWLTVTQPATETNMFTSTSRVTTNKSPISESSAFPYKGTSAVFWIEKIEAVISTDVAPAPKQPTVTIPSTGEGTAIKNPDGVYNFVGSTKITPAAVQDDYATHKIYYIIGDKALTNDDFKKSEATELALNGSIDVTEKCFVNILLSGIYGNDEEADGTVISYEFAPLEIAGFKSVAELNQPENDGKLVSLDCPMHLQANATRFGDNATTGYMRTLLLRDFNKEAVKVTTLTNTNSSKISVMTPAQNNHEYRKYTKPKSIIGKFIYNGGHPEIRIADSKATDTYDYSSFIITETVAGDADIKALTGMTPSFEVSDMFITEPSADSWGYPVTICHLTYKGKDGNNFLFTTPDGTELNSITYYATSMAPTAGTEYTVTGYVEHDAATGEYYFSPGNFKLPLLPITLEGADATTIEGAGPHAGETGDDADAAFDVVLLKGTVNFSFSRMHQTNKNELTYSVYDMLADEPGKFIKSSSGHSYTTTRSDLKLSVNSGDITWVEGSALLKVVVTARSNGSAPIEDISNPYYIRLYDAVAFGLQAETVEGFRGAYAGKTTDDVNESTFVTIAEKGSGKYGKLVITEIRDKYIVVRDIPDGMTSANDKSTAEGTDLTGKNDYLLIKADGGWMEETDEKEPKDDPNYAKKYKYTFHAFHSYRYTNDDGLVISDYFYEKLEPGDAIQQVTGHPVYENGNWILDATGAHGIFSVHKKYQRASEPRMSEELESLRDIELIDNAGERELTDDDLNKLVTLRGISVTSDGVVYTTATKTPATLTWNYLTDAMTSTANKALIDAADASATFNVTGLVMSDGKGGYAIEIMDFAPDYAKIAEVCDHAAHTDTYYANIGFDAAQHGGKMVAARGVKIKENGDGTYSLRLKNDVKLEWTSLASQEAAHKALITAAIENGLTTAGFNVAGKLSDDGTSIDVLIFESLKSDAAPALDVYADAVGTGNYYFNAYTTPVFNVGSEERIFFRMADTEEALDDAEEMVYDPDNAPRLDHSTWIRAYTCTPGAIPTAEVTRQLVKRGLEIDKIDDMTQAGTTTVFHFKGNLRVADINAGNGYMVVTDGTTHVSIHTTAETLAGIAEGDHLDELVALRDANTYHYLLSTSLPLQKVQPTEEVKILTPAAITAMPTADDRGRHVKIAAARLAGNAADGLTLTSGEIAALPINDILGTLGDDIDTDAEYILTGYVMPALPAASTAGVMALADETETEPAPAAEVELWPSSFTVRRTTATPTFKVEGARTVDYQNGTAMTVGQATVTIECGEAAEIEYSLDGTNWQAYTEALTIDKSCTVSARATAEDMYVSATATMQIVRKYISAGVAIDPAELAGYTAVVIMPADPSMDPSTFTIHYTTDGTEPTAGSPKYEYGKMLELEKPCTVKAILIENGADMLPSEVAEEQINVVSGNVTVSVRKGNGESFVTIAPASDKHLAANRKIFYTFDFDLPYDEWTAYTEGTEIRLTEDATIYAYMTEDGKDKGDDYHYDVTVTSTPTTPDDPTDPDDPSAIDSVGADQTTSVSVSGNSIIAPEGSQAFDLTGRQVRMDGLRPGIYIVRTPDGKAIKVRINN